MLESRIDREMDKRKKLREFEDRIQNCIDNPEDLNNWEEEFLDTIKVQIVTGRFLTSRQLNTLEKLEYKVEWGMDEYWREFGGD